MKQSPSQQAKDAGLKSLAQVSDMTGQSVQTLHNWAKNKPKLFDVVIAGCVSRKKQEFWLQIANPKYDDIKLFEKQFKEMYECNFNPSKEDSNEMKNNYKKRV